MSESAWSRGDRWLTTRPRVGDVPTAYTLGVRARYRFDLGR